MQCHIFTMVSAITHLAVGARTLQTSPSVLLINNRTSCFKLPLSQIDISVSDCENKINSTRCARPKHALHAPSYEAKDSLGYQRLLGRFGPHPLRRRLYLACAN